MRGQICLLYEKIPKFFVVVFSSGDSASYFIEMFMLISLECILVQTKMGFGMVT